MRQPAGLTGMIDAHAHYDEACFTDDLPAVLNTQRQNGVCAIINSGSDMPSSGRTVALAKHYPYVYATVGVFPLAAYGLPSGWLDEIETLCAAPGVVGIGEIGLDYHNLKDYPAGEQQPVFAAQLQLAQRLGLPVVIHDREADEDVARLLERYPVAGVIHRFFSRPWAAQRLLELGMHLGIGCAINGVDAAHLAETVRSMPLERLVLETDSPFLPPPELAGQRSTSDMIAYAAGEISRLRGDVSPQEIVDIARENTLRLFPRMQMAEA